jgi:hypothetical protein
MLAFTSIYPSNSLAVDDLKIVDNMLLGVGGDTWKQGVFLEHSLSTSATNLETVSNKRVFTFFEDGDFLKAAGTDARIYEDIHVDGDWPIRKLPAWGLIKDVIKTPKGYLAVGGKSFSKGYIYVLDANMEWVSEIITDQEISAIEEGFSGNYILSAYGSLMFLDADYRINHLPVDGDFFTDLSIQGQSGLCIGSNGTLLKTVDGGQSWSTIEKGNQILHKNSHWNVVLPISEGWIIGGRSGQISFISMDFEILESWKVEEDIDILSLAKSGQQLFIGGRFGEIGYVNLP